MGLTLAITGAGGFIGRATVDAALRRGHSVRALTRRPDPSLPPEAEQIVCDLAADEAKLIDALSGSDIVIHAAATMGGPPETVQRDTLQATQTLLSALSRLDPQPRLVLVSSIAVYDATARRVDETTRLESRPQGRDAYARAKLAQEALLEGHEFTGWIARPGFVFGPGRIWNAHLGHKLGPLFLRLGSGAQIPLVGLVPCAEALVRAAQTPPRGGGMRPINLVESDLPDARRYLSALGPAAPRWQIGLPWHTLATLGHLIGLVPSLRARRPGLLQPRTLSARFGRKTWSNARAEAELHWLPRQPFENALHAALVHTPGRAR